MLCAKRVIQIRTTSRRAILAGIAAAPALTAPALAGDDAELLRLGRELAKLIPEHAAARAESGRLHEALDLAIDRHLGLPEKRDRIMRTWEGGDRRQAADALYEEVLQPRHDEWHEARESPDSKPYGSLRRQYDAAYDRWNDLVDRGQELADAIYQAPAHTVAGLGVKALAVVFQMNRDGETWWEKEEEASAQPDEEQAAICLVKAVTELASIAIPKAPGGAS